jgi:hypothetical protein
MFDNPTVFILGAGASWHYGYPTGEELIEKVRDKARRAKDYFSRALKSPADGTSGIPPRLGHRPQYIMRHSSTSATSTEMAEEWSSAIDECQQMIDRLITVDPLVIDYFLGQNTDLQALGKFLIAWVLLECEAIFSRDKVNNNRRDLLLRTGIASDYDKALNRAFLQQYKDNWYRFLIHKLVVGCPDAPSLLRNNVTLVTFNYDVSLEYQLFCGLSSIRQFVSEQDVIREFFGDGRFIHIYGKLRDDAIAEPPPFNLALFGDGVILPGPEPPAPQLWIQTKTFFDTVYDASLRIRTIAPREKTIDPGVQAARRAIEEASCVYILGYGFDPYNSDLLELPKHLALTKTRKTVMFTNFRNYNVVNKNASRVFFNRRDRILSSMPDVIGGETDGFLCERSIHSVYDALAQDFDSPEENLLSATQI